MSTSSGESARSSESEGARVLIVDDDHDTSIQLSHLLTMDGYACEQASNGLEALRAIGRRPFDVVVSDVKMEGMNGLELLDRVVAMRPLLPVILCTGFSAVAAAVDATKRGAFQYLAKPYDLAALERAMVSAIRERRAPHISAGGDSKARLARTHGKPPEELPEPTAAPLILGETPAMLALHDNIASVARSSAPVLISGESGTGKDLVARAIHLASARRDRPFVAVNVSAIPEHLLESEIFGHVRGAFTGAGESRRGLFVEANGGTLFLDEIGDMPIALQAKLLRVLQFGEVRAVGADSARRVDARLVAATHHDLIELIAAGRFREDLYFRIEVLPINVPPLRERRSDIIGLARHFLEGARRRTPSSPVRALGEDSERVLAEAVWLGNVRQLESTIERLVVFGREATVHEAELLALMQQRPILTERAAVNERVVVTKEPSQARRRSSARCETRANATSLSFSPQPEATSGGRPRSWASIYRRFTAGSDARRGRDRRPGCPARLPICISVGGTSGGRVVTLLEGPADPVAQLTLGVVESSVGGLRDALGFVLARRSQADDQLVPRKTDVDRDAKAISVVMVVPFEIDDDVTRDDSVEEMIELRNTCLELSGERIGVRHVSERELEWSLH